MNKDKIAISIEPELIEAIDNKIDGTIIRSRSQAIEYLVRKGLGTEEISTVVLMVKESHQDTVMKPYKGKSLIEKQIDFFKSKNISKIYVVTQKPSKKFSEFLIDKPVEIVETEAKTNGAALKALSGMIKESFIAMSGDTYNEFDIAKMMQKHKAMNKMMTMGLMIRDNVSNYGTAILDGDMIIDFQERPKKAATHNVNAGIYIFKPEIFKQLEGSLEKDVFPKLAKMKQIVGFFNYGDYAHLDEN